MPDEPVSAAEVRDALAAIDTSAHALEWAAGEIRTLRKALLGAAKLLGRRWYLDAEATHGAWQIDGVAHPAVAAALVALHLPDPCPLEQWPDA